MFPKVSGGFGVTGVEVTTDHTAVSLPFAVFSGTLEDMNAALPDVFN
jgi:hypothetical protein